ncbi:hypothetical protein N7527_002860 [Penicillium freii]|nr:hypothetical protein N7527_002860 [Penicillium freii]
MNMSIIHCNHLTVAGSGFRTIGRLSDRQSAGWSINLRSTALITLYFDPSSGTFSPPYHPSLSQFILSQPLVAVIPLVNNGVSQECLRLISRNHSHLFSFLQFCCCLNIIDLFNHLIQPSFQSNQPSNTINTSINTPIQPTIQSNQPFSTTNHPIQPTI